MKHARSDYNRIQDPAKLIPDDEPVFLLRAKDPDAADAIRHYALLVQRRGGSEAMISICQEHAKAMDAWPTKNKVADLPEALEAEWKEKVRRGDKDEQK